MGDGEGGLAVLVMIGQGLPPCVVFEDDHLLVVRKPAGWNTHAPSPYAGAGIFEWLRDREPRWARLAIIHRLDKETSGLLVFGLTQDANRSLTEQFAGRRVEKEYVLATRRPVPFRERVVRTRIVRVGENYAVQPGEGGDDEAETEFQVLEGWSGGGAIEASGGGEGGGGLTFVRARPRTGRTHQIRVHAAHLGMPIHGDVRYGGEAAGRIWLHAVRLVFAHPATGWRTEFECPPSFEMPMWRGLREAWVVPGETSALRWWHGWADDPAGGRGARSGGHCIVEQWGDFVLVQTAEPGPGREAGRWFDALGFCGVRGAYERPRDRQVRQASGATVSPRWVTGAEAPPAMHVMEHGVRYEVRFGEGYSVGLFLDQRENRRRVLNDHVSAVFGGVRPGASGGGERPGFLNVFAYTCGFSVVAALAGWRVTSVDLSRKYLDWGRRNFELNGLESADHEFVFGDAFDWLRRLGKKGRRFEAMVLDPPTFSQSKEGGVFRAEADYGRLVSSALGVLAPGGVLLASCNQGGWAPGDFVQCVEGAVIGRGRSIQSRYYAPQPPDFPVTRDEPAYLKGLWLRVGG